MPDALWSTSPTGLGYCNCIMRVQLAKLRNQLWDASRQMDPVYKAFPRLPSIRRARKDVNAALHGAYEFYRRSTAGCPEHDAARGSAAPALE